MSATKQRPEHRADNLQVSAVIPLYNGAEFIERTIQSIDAQRLQPREIIVVDDGSSDHGPEIVAAMKHPRLHLISQENSGPGAARNRGADVVRSPWIAFLDADDVRAADFLQIANAALQAAPTVHFYCGGSRGVEASFDPGLAQLDEASPELISLDLSKPAKALKRDVDHSMCAPSFVETSFCSWAATTKKATADIAKTV